MRYDKISCLKKSIRWSSVALASALLLASTSSVWSFSIKKSYSMNGQLGALDNRCLTKLKREIAPQFEGLKTVKIAGPNVMHGVAGGNTLLIYAGVHFQSKFGATKGVLNCVFKGGSSMVTDIVVTFEGKGLAGFKKHIQAKTLYDPAKQFSKGFGRSF